MKTDPESTKLQEVNYAVYFGLRQRGRAGVVRYVLDQTCVGNPLSHLWLTLHMEQIEHGPITSNTHTL